MFATAEHNFCSSWACRFLFFLPPDVTHRECTCGTSRTGCWWGSTKVWPRASTQSTPASEDTTKTSSPVAAKVPPRLCTRAVVQRRHLWVFLDICPTPTCPSQTTKSTSGTAAANFPSLNSRATRAQSTVWAGTRPFPGSWPRRQTTAQYAFGVRRPSSTLRRQTDSTVKAKVQELRSHRHTQHHGIFKRQKLTWTSFTHASVREVRSGFCLRRAGWLRRPTLGGCPRVSDTFQVSRLEQLHHRVDWFYTAEYIVEKAKSILSWFALQCILILSFNNH